MTQTMVDVINVRLEKTASGLYCATSPELTGLCVSHPDIKAIYEDMPNIITLWFKSNLDKDVTVMQEPISNDNTEFDWRSVAVPAEVAAMATG